MTEKISPSGLIECGQEKQINFSGILHNKHVTGKRTFLPKLIDIVNGP